MADDDREYSGSEEEEEDEDVGKKKSGSGQKPVTREESPPKMTEAELIMEEKLRKKKEEDEAMWQEYIEQWRKQRAKEEQELKKLKERQAKRKVQRAEQEKRLTELKRKQEAKARREAEEKKNREAEAKRKRLEDAERKRQAMMEEKKQREAKPNFVIQKKDGTAPSINPAVFDKMSNIDQARSEMGKSKEQLAEDKQIALTYRIKPLNIEGLSSPKLQAYAGELWSKIVQLESEKYDLEDRVKRQDYDLRELTERQKQINRQKALKKGIDPAEAEGKYPPKLQVASKYERRTDRRTFGDKKSLFEGPKIIVASKFERRVDRRTYGDKKHLFDGGIDDLHKEIKEKSWKERMEGWKERGAKPLPKWDPTAPKVKEIIEKRDYEDDDLLDIEPPYPGLDEEEEEEEEPLPPPKQPSPPPAEEEEEEEEEEEDEEEEEE